MVLSAAAGSPGRLVMLKEVGLGTRTKAVKIAMAVPLSAASDDIVRAHVLQQFCNSSRAHTQLSALWGRGAELARAKTQRQWRHQHIETCKLVFGLRSLRYADVRQHGLDRRCNLLCLEPSSKTWQKVAVSVVVAPLYTI